MNWLKQWAGVVLVLTCLSSVSIGQSAALVVIDMQEWFVDWDFSNTLENRAKFDQVIQRQIYLIQQAQKHQLPIALVEYAGKGATTQRILDALGNYPKVTSLQKARDGMFEGWGAVGSLKGLLRENQTTDLLITGANGGACVRRSIGGALARDLNVWTDPQAIIDFNSKDFKYPYLYNQGMIDSLPEAHRARFHQLQDDETLQQLLQGSLYPSDSFYMRDGVEAHCPTLFYP